MKQGDLTKGSVFRAISLFALPMLLGNLLQQMYNVVDTWVVGKYISSDALAGVGSAYTLMVFLTSILLEMCMGSGVVFSLCFGQKNEEKLKVCGICTSRALFTVGSAACFCSTASTGPSESLPCPWFSR